MKQNEYTKEALALLKKLIATPSVSRNEKEAADINFDDKVDTDDSRLLLYHRAEVKNYNLNYNNSL